MKISKSIGQRVLVMLQPSLNYIPLLEQFSPSLMLCNFFLANYNLCQSDLLAIN